MSVSTETWPSITSREAGSLAGASWNLDGWLLTFGAVHSGGEGFAYSMRDESGEVVAFLRFLDPHRAKEARLHRTQWLMGQGLLQDSEIFRGMPHAWVSTQQYGPPAGTDLEFIATFHDAVPGESWKAIKNSFTKESTDRTSLPTKMIRARAAKNLIATLAALESLGESGFIHGDLSDGNLILDPKTGKVCLIDFDAFVYVTSETLKHPRITPKDGGVTGTPGYQPVDLEDATSLDAFAYSDRHARDMLLIELLAFDVDTPEDVAPCDWTETAKTLNTVRPMAKQLGLGYLSEPSIFEKPESERPSSRQLAADLGLSIPAFPNMDFYFGDPLSDEPADSPVGFNVTDGKIQPRVPIQPRHLRPKRSRQPPAPEGSSDRSYTNQLEPIADRVLGSFVPSGQYSSVFAAEFLPRFLVNAVLWFVPILFIYYYMILAFFWSYLPSNRLYESLQHGALNTFLYVVALTVDLYVSAGWAVGKSPSMQSPMDPVISGITQGIRFGYRTLHVFLIVGAIAGMISLAAVRSYQAENFEGASLPLTAPEAMGWPLTFLLLLGALSVSAHLANRLEQE